MRILALETSTACGSLALLESGNVLSEFELPPEVRTAQSLAPAMARLLREAGWEPSSISLVAVTQGPGSFTGLRIAVTAAKVFAYATQSSVIAVDTLEVLVHQLPAETCRACAVMDAQRQQLFAAQFERHDSGQWQSVQGCQVIDLAELTLLLDSSVLLTGPILTRIAAQLPVGLSTSPASCWQPRASTVGRLAWRAYEAGQRDDMWQLLPHYYRPSYAEEKRR